MEQMLTSDYWLECRWVVDVELELMTMPDLFAFSPWQHGVVSSTFVASVEKIAFNISLTIPPHLFYFTANQIVFENQ